jgi:putative flippase GtrA
MRNLGPSKDELRRFALFVMVGLIAAIASLIVRGLFSRVVLFEIAVVIAQVAGLGVAFALARTMVFTKFSGSVAGALRRFFVINVFSLTIVTVVSAVFYRSVLPLLGWSMYPDYTAHFIGLGVATFPAYFGHRFYSFRA